MDSFGSPTQHTVTDYRVDCPRSEIVLNGWFGGGMEKRDESTSNSSENSGSAPLRKGVAHSTMGRRSSRVMIEVPVDLIGRTANGLVFREETRTIVVNAHGALLNSAMSLDITSTIVVKNKKTNDEVQCRVIYRRETQQGRADMGIEFIAAHPTFWAITFPPDDWIQTERKRTTDPSK
jgi:hypothetical protein